MSDQRYSVMVLPRRRDGSILLQTWANEDGVVTDGFGSFYAATENPRQTAAKVLDEYGIEAQLIEVARLQYFMDKPSGLVDLKITVYFAHIDKAVHLQERMDWFALNKIPYEQIHPAICEWLPLLLDGQLPLKASVKVYQPGDHTKGEVTEFVVEK